MSSNSGIARFQEEAVKASENVEHFFKPIDKGSSMPSWYYDRQVEEENEWIKNAEKQLADNLIPQDKIIPIKAELQTKKIRFEKIKEAHEDAKELVNKDPDAFVKRRKELADLIKQSMFTRDEMFHRPARSVDPRHEAERSQLRNGLVKEWKIIGYLLGESTNVEALRKGK